MKSRTTKKYFSVAEVAEILGVSRVAVFEKIKKGKLPAIRIGRAYAIDPKVLGLKPGEPSNIAKEKIRKAVKRVFDEYGEALEKLGKE